jgi:DNA-binding transcriptional regulator YiaG
MSYSEEKKKASLTVSKAIREKRLVRMGCEVCGSIKGIHGHHEDYSKPLEVNWLCKKHHSSLHGQRMHEDALHRFEGHIKTTLERQVRIMGTTIKEGRKALGMTVQQLAAVLGCSISSVNRWEYGTSVPHKMYQKKIDALLAKVKPQEQDDAPAPR